MKTLQRHSRISPIAVSLLSLTILLIAWHGAAAQTNTFPSSGNVGIGTTSPGEKLDILDNAAGVSGPRIRLMTTDTTANKYSGFQFNSGSTFKGGLFRVLSNDDLQIWTAGDTTNPRVTFQNSGKVGIGTTSPASPAGFVRVLHLRDSASASYVADVGGSYRAEFGVSSSGGWVSTGDSIPLRFATANLERVRIDSSGNVGIGTAAPGYKLDVNGTVNATGLNVNGSPITSSQWTTSGSNINYATVGGNVGIGTPTPTYKLHVTGNGRFTGDLTVDGNLAAKYQDVAEWVPSTQQLSAGTVVVLDSTKANEVIASTQEYDMRVAGVISAQPGITLGEKADNKVLVATTGRVRVKVDATKSPIHIGDLLVTSDIPGVAMKSEPVEFAGRKMHMPGTIIGKALEPLAKGAGEILVLLSLQ